MSRRKRTRPEAKQQVALSNDGIKLDGMIVQALDGMVQLRHPQDPEIRFIWTKRQATDFAALVRPEAPRLAAALGAAAEGASRLAAVARSFIPLDA